MHVEARMGWGGGKNRGWRLQRAGRTGEGDSRHTSGKSQGKQPQTVPTA